MSQLEIGRLLRADTSGFVVGCRAAQSMSPSFGSLVNVPQEGDYAIYGLVHDIRIDDDGLVRQLATAEGVEDSVIADNRINRNVPLEISVIAVGYRKGERIYHLLPPRPALSLDEIYLCEPEECACSPAAGLSDTSGTSCARKSCQPVSCWRHISGRRTKLMKRLKTVFGLKPQFEKLLLYSETTTRR